MTILKFILFIIFEALLVLSYKKIKTEKTALFKNIIFILFQIVIITWFVPASYFSGGELAELEMNRIGIFDFFQLLFGSFQFQYFIQILFLLVSVGALYGVLGTTGKYRAWIEKVANKFKRKEKIFLILVASLLAILTSAFDYGLMLLIFIPAIISIILTMGYDKITAVLSTFGAMLIGTIGATFNENIIGTINSQIPSATNTTGIIFKIALLVLSLATLIVYLVRVKLTKTKKDDEIEDLFIGEKSSNKYPVWPVYVMFIVIFVILVLACTPWTSFNINLFTNVHKAVTEFTLADISFLAKWFEGAKLTTEPFFGSILGTITEFGSWYYAEMSVVCLIAAIVMGKVYRKKLSEVFANMAEGALKMIKPALLIMLAYTVVYFTGNTYFFPTIADKILSLTKGFNVFTTTVATALGSLLHVDMVYVSNYILPQTVGMFAGSETIVALITQSIYGVTMFVAPTSALIILGLSYLNISYKEWIKKTWLLTLLLLAVSLVVVIIAALI